MFSRRPRIRAASERRGRCERVRAHSLNLRMHRRVLTDLGLWTRNICFATALRRCMLKQPDLPPSLDGQSESKKLGWTKTGIARGETRPELRLVSSNRPQRPQNKVHACRLISTARHAYIELCDCFAGRNAQSGEPSMSSTEVAPAPSPAPAASLRPSLQGAHYP